MSIVFHPVAYKEFAEAEAFYEEQLAGLGRLFLTEVYEAIDLIRLYPEGCQFITRRTRKCSLRRQRNRDTLSF